MTHIKPVNIELEKILPDKDDVFELLNIPFNKISRKHMSIYESMIPVLKEIVSPVGLITEIDISDFLGIYENNENKSVTSPIKNIIINSKIINVFAITLGNKITDEINGFISNNDYAEAVILDSIASCSADNFVECLRKDVNDKISKDELNTKTVSYSPGYCGWDISSQKYIFGFLNPERIGITLNESFLMTPIKSVTGILINADKDFHLYKNEFDFCIQCKTMSCLKRNINL